MDLQDTRNRYKNGYRFIRYNKQTQTERIRTQFNPESEPFPNQGIFSKRQL